VFRKEGIRPAVVVHQAEPFPSFHPVVQGRPHPRHPCRRFHPGPSVRGFSGSLSPFGHSRGGPSVVQGRRAFSFLCPFAPWALPHFTVRMDTLTSRPVSPRTGSPRFHASPSAPSASNHPAPLCRRFFAAPQARRADRRCGPMASSFFCRLADDARPNRVRYPADGSFAFRRSPPCLAATQFRSASGRRATTGRGLSPL